MSDDQRERDWYRFYVRIQDLISDGTVTYVEDKLRDIQRSVEESQRVTPDQARFVDSVDAATKRKGAVDRARRGYESGHYRKWGR